MFRNLLNKLLGFIRSLRNRGYAVPDGVFAERLKRFESHSPYPLPVFTAITNRHRAILALLQMRRGVVHAPAQCGKSLSLLLYANDLRANGTVGILVADERVAAYFRSLARSAFHSDPDFKITSRVDELMGRDAVLVDEPANLTIRQRGALSYFRKLNRVLGEVQHTSLSTIWNDVENRVA